MSTFHLVQVWYEVFYSLKTGYIEFAMAGNYSTIGIVQMCSHWAPGGGGGEGGGC